jgi:hypothetical protein
MTPTPVAGTLVASYNGSAYPSYDAVDPDERVALVERFLAEPDLTCELGMDFRPGVHPPQPRGGGSPHSVGYLLIGFGEGCGAAYLLRRIGPDQDHWPQRSTRGTEPSREPSNISYDCHTGHVFVRHTVVPIDQIRSIMIDYALAGTQSDAVRWMPFDYDIDTWAPEPDDATVARLDASIQNFANDL